MSSERGKLISSQNFDEIIKEDVKEYSEYFDSIRNYIIDNLDKFSTQSLIEGMEKYFINDVEDIDERSRLQQAVEVYNYCKQHPNNVEPNDKDFILAVLFSCGFVYYTYNSCCWSSAHDEFEKIDTLLRTNDINVIIGSGGCYGVVTIRDIEGTLKLLIPEFNVEQPKYHYHVEGFDEIEALDEIPFVRFVQLN